LPAIAADGEPASGVFHVAAVCLKTKSAVIAAKDIYTTAAIGVFKGFNDQMPDGHGAASGIGALEGNFIVQIAAATAAKITAATATASSTAAIPEVATTATASTAFGTTVQHSQFTAVTLQYNFRGVLFSAALILPFAGLQGAFNINFRAFA